MLVPNFSECGTEVIFCMESLIQLGATTLCSRSQISSDSEIRVLLIGPYDPYGGEYTFLAPPLGVWRLAGVLRANGVDAEVFDPNCCSGSVTADLETLLTQRQWNVIGISTTGMTLPYDLSLAYVARRVAPKALLAAGGMEATFNAAQVLAIGPFDLIVLGEGERPLLEVSSRLRSQRGLEGIAGTAFIDNGGQFHSNPQQAMNHDELRDAIFQIPYDRMPYRAYWDRLEAAYRVHALPIKAEREARLTELYSVRLITLNYCPMGCTFCSSTNFLHAAQGGATARVARLDHEECLAMICKIITAHPGVRTLIFQDDIFVFTQDSRILQLCDAIVAAKERNEINRNLQFISTNRIDAMTPERLAGMRRAGFRVLGFGVESFSLGILREFNKAHIFPFIEPVLRSALSLGITPFLDMILTSPRCNLEDLAENIRQAYTWIQAGCEVGMYPYVIPFSGAAMAKDQSLRSRTILARRNIQGTNVSWDQPTKILPISAVVADAILSIEENVEVWLARLTPIIPHLPSRVRSLIWIAAAIPILDKLEVASLPSLDAVLELLSWRLPSCEPESGLAGVLRELVPMSYSDFTRRVGGHGVETAC